MDQRFRRLFNMSEADAIAILDAPPVEEEVGNSRYAAAAQLINYPTDASISALIRAVQRTDDLSLDNRIVRRKSVESLGKLRALQSLSVISDCLSESDHLTIENAVWAIGEIGTTDESILAAVTYQLTRDGQNHRVIIHTLAKLNYTAALEQIRPFIESEDAPVASAAISAVCRLTNDYALMAKVEEFMFHPMVIVRRLAIQDLIDAKYTHAIHEMSRSPVSIAFRLRGIRVLSTIGYQSGTLTMEQTQPYIEKTLLDHPEGLDLVHAYDVTPDLSFLIRELYQTDFGRCYLAVKTLLAEYPTETPAALIETYEAEAHNDYGAHFHVMKLFGWLKHSPAYGLLIEALHNHAPQFQKSRAAAAIALGELGDTRAIAELNRCLESNIWELQYASLLALEKLGETRHHASLTDHPDWLIRAKAAKVS